MILIMPPTAPNSIRRSQAERSDESERLLVEATLSVVAERGVSAATFEEIGREAGYSRSLAAQKFGSKQGLIEAVIVYLHRRREAIMEASHVAEMSALDAIDNYIESHLVDMNHRHGGRAYFMLLAAAVADATSMREAFAASHERVRVWLKALLRRGQVEGDIRPDIDPDSAALMIGSLLVGVSIQWLIDPTTDVDQIQTTSIAAIRRSFETDPASP
jgi:AcrR family transcriptional regulator